MTREERNYKLKKYIICLKCGVSGKCCDDNCPTQYEAGNIGEIIENLEAISKLLEQEPKTNVLDKIRAEIKDNRDEWIKGEDPEWHTYDRCLQIIDKYKAEKE